MKIKHFFKKINAAEFKSFTSKYHDFIPTIFSHYINTFLNVVFQLIQIPIFLKIFSSVEFGFLIFLINLINFSSIGIGWLSSGIMKSFGESHYNNNKIVVSKLYRISSQLTIFYVTAFILFFLSTYLLVTDIIVSKSDFYISLLVISLSIYLKLIPNIEIQYLNSIEKQSIPIKIDNIRLFILILLILIFKDYFSKVYHVLLLICISLLFNFVTLKLLVKQKIEFLDTKLNFYEDFKNLLGVRSIKYGILGLLIIILQSDLIILGYFGSPEIIKEYIIIWKIPELIFLLLLKIPASLEPTIIRHQASGDLKEVLHLNHKFFKWYLLLILIGVFIYFLTSNFIIKIWLGANYELREIETLICCINVFFITSMRWNLAFLHALAKLDPLIKLLSLEVIFKSFLMFFFIDKFTYLAPILASVVIYIFFFFWKYMKLHKQITK